MHTELLNLYLFAYAIVKCALVTGIGPAIAFLFAFDYWRQARIRVNRKTSGTVLVFPAKPMPSKQPRPCRSAWRQA